MDGGATEVEGGGPLEDLGRLERWWNTPSITSWSIVFFGSFLLNAILLLAFIKRPGLRTISNRFVMNLTVSNLLTVMVLTLLLMMDSPLQSSTFPSNVCSMTEGAAALVTSSSILSVLLIAIDQYLAVVDPLRYRTRISNVKCCILIINMWMISSTLALVAAFNPDPQGLWLVCNHKNSDIFQVNSTFDFKINSTIFAESNVSSLEKDFPLLEIESSFHFIENSTSDIGNKSSIVTYGLIYSLFFGLFIYLIPFIGICWIYVNIYSAAHENSERTRRTGSRPALSSASFTEDYNSVRQDQLFDELRKIPKISSLSSIDESLETSFPSQKRRSSSPIIEEPSSVIFTVGSRRQLHSSETKEPTPPISVLKAEFLGQKQPQVNSNLVKSRFPDEPEQRRKSSHDLMVDNMIRRQRNNSGSESTDDDERKSSKHINSELNGSESLNKHERNPQKLQDPNNQPSLENIFNTSNMYLSITAKRLDKPVNYENSPKIGRQSSSVIFTVGSHQQLHSDDIKNHLAPAISIQKPNYEKPEFSHDLKDDVIGRLKNKSDSESDEDDDEKQFLDQSESLRYNLENLDKNISDSMKDQEKQRRKYVGKDRLASCNYKRPNSQTDHQEYYATTFNPPIVTITPPGRVSLQRVASTRSSSSYINSMKHRISNGSMFKYREESRAARISAVVIVMGFICWTPYIIILGLKNSMVDLEGSIPHQVDIVGVSLVVLATYISPLLFGYRSKRVKRELRKLFCFRKELSYKNNRSLMAKKVLKRRNSGNFSHFDMDSKYNIFNCVYGKSKWPKEKVHFVQVPETALVVETCRSSFSSGASTQISSTSTEEC